MKIAQIYRENAPCVFGVWQGQRTFGVRPLAIFDTYEAAKKWGESLALSREDCQAIETEALWTWQHKGGGYARKLLADMLRAWRRFGDNERAKWLRNTGYTYDMRKCR
jgi:hypothetical protein